MEKLTASDVMSSPARTVSPDTTLAEAADVMLQESIGSLVVLDADDGIAGILTDSDFGSSEGKVPFSTFRAPTLLGRWLGEEGVENIYQEARSRTVTEIMSSPVHTVRDDAPLREILDVMLKRDIKHVPVLREGEVVGMVSRFDLLKAIRTKLGG